MESLDLKSNDDKIFDINTTKKIIEGYKQLESLMENQEMLFNIESKINKADLLLG